MKIENDRVVRFHYTVSEQGQEPLETSEGREQGFLFTPHLARDPFGTTSGDASGQVRQLVGSMVYAATFAQYKLHSPDVFLRRLIDRGVAGDSLGHPLEGLAWIANHLATRGRAMAAGEIVITGSALKTRFPEPGDEVTYRIAGLGETTVRLEG